MLGRLRSPNQDCNFRWTDVTPGDYSNCFPGYPLCTVGDGKQPWYCAVMITEIAAPLIRSKVTCLRFTRRRATKREARYAESRCVVNCIAKIKVKSKQQTGTLPVWHANVRISALKTKTSCAAAFAGPFMHKLHYGEETLRH